MNLEGVSQWVREHPAAAAAGGGALLVALIWAYHRSHSSQTASGTAGSTGATTDGGGQYLVPYDGTSDYTQGDPATTRTLTNILTLLAGLSATEAAQSKTLGKIAHNTAPKKPHKGGHAHGGHSGQHHHPKHKHPTTRPAHPSTVPRPGSPIHETTAPARRRQRAGARLPVAPVR